MILESGLLFWATLYIMYMYGRDHVVSYCAYCRVNILIYKAP